MYSQFMMHGQRNIKLFSFVQLSALVGQ